ncbi:MAG: tyrosine-type recombinase/integrase [Microbacterium gubbeenense]|uniref:tyrosine-type recombinase/integrase n=1 Tax=Microbacterium gubbeenense TaxID=159896 RepID=UPI003F999CB2
MTGTRTRNTRRQAEQRRTPSQWGTTEQLPSGRWRAFYRYEGRKISAPRTFDTRSDASDWLAGERADRSRGTWQDPHAGRITLAEYAREWLAVRLVDLAPRTRLGYADNLDRWIARRVGQVDGSRGIDLGRIDVADVTPALVRSWRAAVLAESRHGIATDKVERAARRESTMSGHPARLWARAKGMPVAASGRISPAVIDAWRAAGEPRPIVTAPTAAPVVLSDDAGQHPAAAAYRLLRTILNTAVTDGLLAANPCQIKGAGSPPTAERPTATPAEVDRLAAAMPDRLAAAVVVAAWSGLRYGELFALARRHVDTEAGTIRVDRALIDLRRGALTFGPPKTAKSRRTVHLPAFVAEMLRDHLAEHVAPDPDALVFATVTGTPLRTSRLSVLFDRARRKVGRSDLHWHDLRHTGATLAYRSGASVPDVQRRLGHTTMRAAQIYAHAADDSDAVLAARLNEMYGGEVRAGGVQNDGRSPATKLRALA